jgi:hypothetical protein
MYVHTYVCLYLCMYVNVCVCVSCISKPISQIFLGIPHPQLSKKVPINMGQKVNRSRDIHCCVEIQEMLINKKHATMSNAQHMEGHAITRIQ